MANIESGAPKEATEWKAPKDQPETPRPSRKEMLQRYDQLASQIGVNLREYGVQYTDWSRDRIIEEIEQSGIMPTPEQSRKVIRGMTDAMNMALEEAGRGYRSDPDQEGAKLNQGIAAEQLLKFAELTGIKAPGLKKAQEIVDISKKQEEAEHGQDDEEPDDR